MKTAFGIIFISLLALLPFFSPPAFGEEKLHILTSDGKTLQAWLFGKSDTALLLCHGRGYKTGAESFRKECRYWENQQLMCLALSFRGYPSDSPPDLEGKELDILAAFEYLVRKGAKRIFILGSSMGGFLILKTLEQLEAKPQFSGIIVLSAFSSLPCTSRRPKLFIVAENDPAYYEGVMTTFAAAAAPKQLAVYPEGGHGQNILQKYSEKVLALITAFIRNSS